MIRAVEDTLAALVTEEDEPDGKERDQKESRTQERSIIPEDFHGCDNQAHKKVQAANAKKHVKRQLRCSVFSGQVIGKVSYRARGQW